MGAKIASLSFQKPKWVVLQVTEKCNLRCKMCYEWGDSGSYFHKNDLRELDIDVAKRVLEELSEAKPYLELFGGEPLMYPHLRPLLEKIQEIGCMVDIPTNGTLLEKHADLLVETEVRRIWVSIDGPEEINDAQRGKGVYQRALRGLRAVAAAKRNRNAQCPLLGVTMVVTPLNYRYVESFFRGLLEEDILDNVSIEFQLYTTKERYDDYLQFVKKEFSIEPDASSMAGGLIRSIADFQEVDIDDLTAQVKAIRELCARKKVNCIGYPKTMTHENVERFYKGDWEHMTDKRSKCSFPWIYMEISANGDVSPCHTFYDVCVGNVYRENIMDIWKGSVYQEFRRKMRNKLSPICSSCSRYYSDL